ncbi:MAG: formate--tetrahydrofolate ligase [Opitutaceae bacterium]
MSLSESHPSSLPRIVSRLELDPAHVAYYGNLKAKVDLNALRNPPRQGKLILVSAITPTPPGEGKTTMSIGLAQALQHIGKRAALALREPSMGPIFGRKGGATGGGRSCLTPADDINLHFTGDFHAVTSAHNLMAATIDNRLHFGTAPMSASGVTWKRVMDMNDRSLRNIRIGIGDEKAERDSGFDITAASEIMAILCLAQSYDDLRDRLKRMVVGFAVDGQPVRADSFGVTDALLAVLRNALQPNLVQSDEGVPAFVHGGPFANIAHGCNSLLATRMALGHADYAVTEAGFAFDLGGEKFHHIKCLQGNLSPDLVVLVATVRALKMHGGQPLAEITRPDAEAVSRGLPNLQAHLDAIAAFSRPVVVALNRFEGDSSEEEQIVIRYCQEAGIPVAVADIFAKGGPGGEELAQAVVHATGISTPPHRPVYGLSDSVETKIRTIATRIYGADGVDFTDEARAQMANFGDHGFDQLPICMAKTQMSLSDDPRLLGRPRGFRITVRGFEVADGAGFLVALTGKMLRMPALPRSPSAERITFGPQQEIRGL